MIEVSIHSDDLIPTQIIDFHGRERRKYSFSRDRSRYLPDRFNIWIYTGFQHTASIEFRGVDCTDLINGILDSADDMTLKQIILGAQDRLEINAERP